MYSSKEQINILLDVDVFDKTGENSPLREGRTECLQCHKHLIDLSKHKTCRALPRNTSDGDTSFVNRILRSSSSSSSVSAAELDILSCGIEQSNVSLDVNDNFVSVSVSKLECHAKIC